MRLLLLILLATTFLNISGVSASAIKGPSCTVMAQVIDKGTETRQLRGINDEVSEYESGFLKLEVLTIKRAGFRGNCDFVGKGNVFKTGDEDLLDVGDKIQAGLEFGGTMHPSGEVSSFIHWEPVSLIFPDREFPSYVSLQSSDEPEKKEERVEKAEEQVVVEEEGAPENIETEESFETGDSNPPAIAPETEANEPEVSADDQIEIVSEETVVEKEHNIVWVVIIVLFLVMGLRWGLKKLTMR